MAPKNKQLTSDDIVDIVNSRLRAILGELDPKQVNGIHKFSDVDQGGDARHHTLGTRSDQSAVGSHRHTGDDSHRIFDPKPVIGTTTDQKVQSLLEVLIEHGLVSGQT